MLLSLSTLHRFESSCNFLTINNKINNFWFLFLIIVIFVSDRWLSPFLVPFGCEGWPTSWPGSGIRRLGGASSGLRTLGTSRSRASTSRGRRRGAPVNPSSEGKGSEAGASCTATIPPPHENLDQQTHE